MEQTPSNIDLEQLLSVMLTDVASEVPVYLNNKEEVLLSIFLGTTKFKSLAEFLKDIECFLNEELDLQSITRENVSKINFSALASKFGKRYRLDSLANVSKSKANEFTELGWKTSRTIFLKVMLPQLQKIPFEEAQQLVMVLEEFIWTYTIIQGESPEQVLDQLKYWEIFKDYRFTLELENGTSQNSKKLPPPDEYIIWTGKSYTIEQIGEMLETKFNLIVDKRHWIQFFKDHVQRIEVQPGKRRQLVAVLHQMELQNLVQKSKNKGMWKIWQVILVDQKGLPFSRSLRKTSSEIRTAASQKNKEDYEFGKRVVNEMKNEEKGNSTTKQIEL